MNADWSKVAHILIRRGWKLATAESCTGGLIAAACTDLAGSSLWFDRGFVTYSNAAKIENLDVQPSLIDQFGAVSENVAKAMALGALKNSHANISLAVTGIAGPGGATLEKPVGTVCFAFGFDFDLDLDIDLKSLLKSPTQPMIYTETMHFSGDRAQVRLSSVLHGQKRVFIYLNQFENE